METKHWVTIVITTLVVVIGIVLVVWFIGGSGNDDEAAAAFEPTYVKNPFSCREPVNVPGSIFRGTLQKCEEACDNIPACVGFDRRSDVSDTNDAFCYLQMSQCNEKTSEKQLSSEQDGEKWKRHIKPSSAL
jgi:hypothetical protein